MTKKITISDEDKRLFAAAVANSKPLSQKKTQSKTTPTKDTQSLAYRRYQASKISTNTDTPANVTADSLLYFCRPHVNDAPLHTVQSGLFTTTTILDLHGLSEENAITQLNQFIYQAQQKKIKIVLIIHGKGARSSHTPILKNMVNQHLRQLDAVLAFRSAHRDDGGAGAVYVLLRYS